MKTNYAFLTNKGCHRAHNEDSILIGKQIYNNISMEEVEVGQGERVFAVADGMGGHQKGEVASRKVLDYLIKDMPETLDDISAKTLVDKIQEDFKNLAEADMSYENMGTTLSTIILDDDFAKLISIGDSRIYRVLGGYLEKLTKDHSIVERMVEAGIISEDEMRTHPSKNRVTSAFIATDDIIEEMNYYQVEVRDKSTFLIVSDGVWEALSIDEMEECLVKNLQKSVENIYNLAMKNSCQDNISLVLLEVEK